MGAASSWYYYLNSGEGTSPLSLADLPDLAWYVRAESGVAADFGASPPEVFSWDDVGTGNITDLTSVGGQSRPYIEYGVHGDYNEITFEDNGGSNGDVLDPDTVSNIYRNCSGGTYVYVARFDAVSTYNPFLGISINSGATGSRFDCGLNSLGRVYLAGRKSDTDSVENVLSSQNVVTSTSLFYRLVFTVNHATKKAQIYVNNTLVADANFHSGNAATTTDDTDPARVVVGGNLNYGSGVTQEVLLSAFANSHLDANQVARVDKWITDVELAGFGVPFS